jgi:SGNH hydrolase-like domain, acetyltransferase AlgX
MRLLCGLALLIWLQTTCAATETGAIQLSQNQQKFSAELAHRFQRAEKLGAGAVVGEDGWLFLSADLRFLSVGQFWAEGALKVSRARKRESADPIPAILDFQAQLRRRGIELLLVPVPPKAAVYPEKIVPGYSAASDDPTPYLHRFYEELRRDGIEVLDLAPVFSKSRENARGALFCKTDTHWSGAGCVMAAEAIAAKVREKIPLASRAEKYAGDWEQVQFIGDLVRLLPAETPKPGPEKIVVRKVKDKATGGTVQPDSDSPLLLLGDSHTLVFHDFLTERAGLIDQLAKELGIAPDLIGTRGSGATEVRISLYRRSNKSPGYLGKKKIVVWCFAAREFTEAEGWEKLPVAK